MGRWVFLGLTVKELWKGNSIQPCLVCFSPLRSACHMYATEVAMLLGSMPVWWIDIVSKSMPPKNSIPRYTCTYESMWGMVHLRIPSKHVCSRVCHAATCSFLRETVIVGSHIYIVYVLRASHYHVIYMRIYTAAHILIRRAYLYLCMFNLIWIPVKSTICHFR